MPNFDGGHYFLTALLPLQNDQLVEHGGVKSSAVHMVREPAVPYAHGLSVTADGRVGAEQPVCADDASARSEPIPPRTHFARFVVIDDIAYNGRDPVDAIRAAAKGIDPITAGPTDSLPCPYLLFVADFDAASGDVTELRDYLAYLWRLMEPELRAIMGYCTDFGRRVTDAASFSAYIAGLPGRDDDAVQRLLARRAAASKSLGRALVSVAIAGLLLVALGAVLMWRQGYRLGSRSWCRWASSPWSGCSISTSQRAPASPSRPHRTRTCRRCSRRSTCSRLSRASPSSTRGGRTRRCGGFRQVRRGSPARRPAGADPGARRPQSS